MSINKSYSYTSSSITKRHLAERGGEIKDTVVPREARKLSPSLSLGQMETTS